MTTGTRGSWRAWACALGGPFALQAGVLAALMVVPRADATRPPGAVVTATSGGSPARSWSADEPPSTTAPDPALEPVDEPPARRSRARAARAPRRPPPSTIAATRDSAPTMVEVDIVSRPEGATVRIGGAVWGVTPLTALLPGSSQVAVQLELDGHQSATLTWSPSSGRRVLRGTLRDLR